MTQARKGALDRARNKANEVRDQLKSPNEKH